MGCGASNDPKIGVADSTRPIDNRSKNQTNRNGFKPVEIKNNSQNNQNSYNYNNQTSGEVKSNFNFILFF